MNHIEEFRSPDFHGIAPQSFVVLLIVAIVALAGSREKLRVSQLLVVIFAAASGIYSARSLPVSSLLFVLTAAPLLSQTIADATNRPELAAWVRRLFTRWESFAARMAQTEVSLRAHLWPLAGIIFGLGICLHSGKLGASQVMDAHFPANRFPVQAVDFLAQQNTHDPVFCPDYWGGYLIYWLAPQTRVVVDDRHDLYGEQFFKRYLNVVQVEPGWEAILNEQHVHAVLAPSESALANGLRESGQWNVAYEDKVGILFER